ncbi:pyridoxamine 5'-phosphate oxidase family protein [Promicromonospora sukumoe]|uniref:pyridoxamine 5'-phosphate oxidase family protein n=1 Tax=Promicromonospora sukumoe TaxID=88382 RepID=UPI000373EDB1|nr:pyridoxamine 5'-phosphate oxidase family protein [Promicromonospora sukumoe]
MHRLLGVPPQDNPTIPGLPAAYAQWMAQSPLLALGTVDRDDRIWTTVLGGRAGVVRPIAPGVLGLSTPAHLGAPVDGGSDGDGDGDGDGSSRTGFDPVLEALFPGPQDGNAVDHADGKLVAGLAMDLEQRTRVKLAGRMLRGVVLEQDATATTGPTDPSRVDLQLALAIDETLGNCPKYLNRKAVWPHEAAPRLVSDSLPLSDDAVRLVGRSDIFFLSSRHGAESMDTNNRGGAPGFVRVLSNSADDGVSLVYPEYSGNRLFQTLGNLRADPAVGITFPDFETGDVLYLTGRAEILVGADAAAVLPHSRMAVKVTVDAARFVSDGLPFRGRLLDPSPYNPPVRRLASEIDATGEADARPDGRSGAVAVATLVRSARITPTVTRHTFRLSPDPSSPRAREEFPRLAAWQPGQHVTLDFSGHLDQGWSHMRDHDPASLNDDYVRSFTVSSPPPQGPASLADVELDVTVRRNGPVTRLLAGWPAGATLTVPVLGFDGAGFDGATDHPAPDEDLVMVAGGVGITPFMTLAGQGGPRSSLLWSLNADDLPLAVDVAEKIGTRSRVTLFVTGEVAASGQGDLRALARLGVDVRTRRMSRDDVVHAGTEGHRRFRVCAGPGLRRSLLDWLAGEQVSLVDFDY